MKRIVVFTGSGISAESGLSTFRDQGGLWEQYRIEDVATPEAWARNPQLVLEFYNQRIRQLLNVRPNKAHLALAQLEQHFDVRIITQNVDDLHERAGSGSVLHLHGELMKCRSSEDPELIYEVANHEIKWGSHCEKGSQLRPHIVWFGEMVIHIDAAAALVATADCFLIVGTSLNVFPAAGLVQFVPPDVPVYMVDPHANEIGRPAGVKAYCLPAGTGVPLAVQNIINTFADA